METGDVKTEVATIFSVVSEKLSNKSKDKLTEENSEKMKEKSKETEIEIDSPVCRICLEGPKNSPLISPCCCSGSCSLVHLKCLQLWLTTSTRKTNECEICKSPYRLKKVKINPNFSQFIRGNPGVVVNLRSFIFLTIGISFLSALALFAIKNTIFVGVGFGFCPFLFLFLAGYFLWIYAALKAHISQWKEFKIQHQQVKLFPLEPKNTGNNNNSKNTAVSMKTETETDEDANVTSKGEMFFGL